MFDEASVQHLLQNKSDLTPVLINPHGYASTPKALWPFHFQAAWLSHELFEDCPRKNWKPHEPLYPLLSHVANTLDD